MAYRIVTADERERARNWYQNTSRLERRATVTVKALAELFAPEGGLAYHELIFVPDPSGMSLAIIKSPTGEGRLVLRLREVDKSLTGQLVVERADKDNRDLDIWLPVWAVYLPWVGPLYVQEPNEIGKFEVDSLSSKTRDTAYFELGMAINYVLLAGPLMA